MRLKCTQKKSANHKRKWKNQIKLQNTLILMCRYTIKKPEIFQCYAGNKNGI